jgi:SAM-dependent methyltransferase
LSLSPMPTETEKEHARELMVASVKAVRAHDHAAAEENARAFLATGFDGFKVRRVLGVVCERKGDFSGAERHLTKALEYKPEDGDTWFHLATIGIFSETVDGFANHVTSYPEKFPELHRRKANFYKSRTLFKFVRERHGRARAVDWIESAMDLPATRHAVLASITRRDASPATYGRASVEDPRLLRAIDALVAGDPGAAVRSTVAFLDDPMAPRAELEVLVREGPDAGHPIWHIINPHFHLRAAADSDEDVSQARWRNTEAIERGFDPVKIENDYQRWRSGPQARLAGRLIEGVASELGRPPTLVDLGCGTGNWLRFFAEYCGLPVQNLGGIELHEARAAQARAAVLGLLTSGASYDGLSDVVAANIVRGDLLNLDIEGLRTRHPSIDMVTLFVVAGCFDDGQLSTLLDSISRLGPTRVMTTTVTKKWDLWHGREDEDDYFAQAGYQLTSRAWDPIPLVNVPDLEVVGPRSYWVNRSLSLFQRV